MKPTTKTKTAADTKSTQDQTLLNLSFLLFIIIAIGVMIMIGFQIARLEFFETSYPVKGNTATFLAISQKIATIQQATVGIIAICLGTIILALISCRLNSKCD